LDREHRVHSKDGAVRVVNKMSVLHDLRLSERAHLTTQKSPCQQSVIYAANALISNNLFNI
jgi:hypothetical protein